jgi:hypothetical protein
MKSEGSDNGRETTRVAGICLTAKKARLLFAVRQIPLNSLLGEKSL